MSKPSQTERDIAAALYPPKTEWTTEAGSRAASCSPHDWPEDASHENGNYRCQCGQCDVTFTGHKRRVVCKRCAKVNQAQWEAMTEPQRQKALSAMNKAITDAVKNFKENA